MGSPLSVGAATVALAIGAAAPAAAGDWSQLVAAARLSPAEAEGMTLTELAARKFSRDGAGDDDVTVSPRCDPLCDAVSPRQRVVAAGPGPHQARGLTLTEISRRRVDLRRWGRH
jgi:hypothetical protein